MIQAVIFDLDGTILDSTGIWMQAGGRYLQTMGIASEDHLGEILFAMSMQEGADYLQKQYRINISIKQIVAGIHDVIRQYYEQEIRPKDGVIEYIKQLYALQVPMSIATATDRVLVETALKRIGILDYFQKIFTCTEVGINKTSPDIYLQACTYMNAIPQQTWVFEDAIHAARTVKKAGFLLAGVYDEISAEAQRELFQLSDIYLEKFVDFTAFCKYADSYSL